MMMIRLLFAVTIILLIAGCNKPPAEKMLADAREAEKGQNFLVALERYANVVQEYPESAVAETSMFTIATIRQNDMKQPTEAVAAFRKYIEKYPQGTFTPIATFLIGYIYNNDLHNYDSAATAYRTFLAKYPLHEMAKSAQFELDNLGKRPEEIFPSEVVTQEPAQSPVAPGKPVKKSRR